MIYKPVVFVTMAFSVFGNNIADFKNKRNRGRFLREIEMLVSHPENLNLGKQVRRGGRELLAKGRGASLPYHLLSIQRIKINTAGC